MTIDVPDLLNKLSAYGEKSRIEAKRASEIGPSIHQTICAFANEPQMNGGFLLLGVEEDDAALFPVYQVLGVKNQDKLINELVTQCNSVFSSVIRPQIDQQLIEGKLVIGVYIPEAAPSDKPVYIKKQGLPKGAYRRSGSSDVVCTDDDIQLLYQGRSSDSYDYTIMPDGDLEDFDPNMLELYRKARRESNPAAEELNYSDQDLLIALSAIRRDQRGHWKPTVAGILLFGTSIALRRHFPMMRVDYIRVKGKEWLSDPTERFFSQDMRFPLMQVIDRAQAAIFEDLPIAFSLPEGSLQREDKPLLPARAIREAVVNAVMHRNYRANSPVQIIRYSNRLEIRNMGYSLVSDEHLGEPQSATRNPKIAAVLHDTRYAEQKGSGIGVMRRMMQDERLSPPIFESDRYEDRFSVTFLFHHFLNEADLNWLSQWSHLELSDDDRRALVTVREAGSINNATYRSFGNLDTLTASKQLKKLCDLGLLEMQGKGSKTFYVAGFLMNNSSSGDSPGETAKPQGKTGKLEPQLQEFDPLLQEFGGLLQELSALSPELAQKLQQLGPRTSREYMQQLILELCALKPWRVEELATLTRRELEGLRREYVLPLFNAGKLERTIPQTPNHPHQAYRTKAGTP